MTKTAVCDIMALVRKSGAGAWPSGKATDFESVYRGFESLRPSLMDSALSESEARRQSDRETESARVSTGLGTGAALERPIAEYGGSR